MITAISRWKYLFIVSVIVLPPGLKYIRPSANGRNIVGKQLPTLLDVTCCVRFHTLLHVVGCCCVLLRKVWNRSNFWTSNFKHFFCSVIAEAWRNNVGFVCTALPTSTHAHYTWFTKVLWVASFPLCTAAQHCWQCTPLPTLLAQHCWELAMQPRIKNKSELPVGE